MIKPFHFLVFVPSHDIMEVRNLCGPVFRASQVVWFSVWENQLGPENFWSLNIWPFLFCLSWWSNSGYLGMLWEPQRICHTTLQTSWLGWNTFLNLWPTDFKKITLGNTAELLSFTFPGFIRWDVSISDYLIDAMVRSPGLIRFSGSH